MTAAHVGSATPLSHVVLPGGLKICTLAVTLSASYATAGSAIDLSTSGLLGAALGFQTVTAGVFGGHITAGSSKYHCVFVPAASDAAATCLIKEHDNSAGADAEVSSTTDISTSVVRFTFYGT